jgi:hypothetical protein
LTVSKTRFIVKQEFTERRTKFRKPRIYKERVKDMTSFYALLITGQFMFPTASGAIERIRTICIPEVNCAQYHELHSCEAFASVALEGQPELQAECIKVEYEKNDPDLKVIR